MHGIVTRYDKKRWKLEKTVDETAYLLTDLKDSTIYLLEPDGEYKSYGAIKQVNGTDNEFLVVIKWNGCETTRYGFLHVELKDGDVKTLFFWADFVFGRKPVELLKEWVVFSGDRTSFYSTKAKKVLLEIIREAFGIYVYHKSFIDENGCTPRIVVRICDHIEVDLDASTLKPISKLYSKLRNSVRKVSTLEEVVKIYHQDELDERKIQKYEMYGFPIYNELVENRKTWETSRRWDGEIELNREKLVLKLLEKSNLAKGDPKPYQCFLLDSFDYYMDKYQIIDNNGRLIIRAQNTFTVIRTGGVLRGISEIKPDVFLALFEDIEGWFLKRFNVVKYGKKLEVYDDLARTFHDSYYMWVRLDAWLCQISPDMIVTNTGNIYSISENKMSRMTGWDSLELGRKCLGTICVMDKATGQTTLAHVVVFSDGPQEGVVTMIDVLTSKIISKTYDYYTDRFEDIGTGKGIKQLFENRKRLTEWAEAEIAAIPPREY